MGAVNGPLVALDAATGCLRWSAPVKGVRSAISIGRAAGVDALFYGDATGTEHAVALSDGRELWNRKIADHPTAIITGASAYYDGRLYVPLASYEEVAVLSPGYHCCTFRGSVTALDTTAGNGSVAEPIPSIEPRSLGCGHLVGPNARPGAPRALCHHRRQLLRARQRYQRRRAGLRSRIPENGSGRTSLPRATPIT